MINEEGKANFWSNAKAICALVLTITICIKIFLAPISLSLDATTLISFLLALFSIWLSALFYFKATETSNTFYDNTYKFTRDIAQLLAKMESGFGERLRNLDEGYASMRNYLQSPIKHADDTDVTKQKLEDERNDLKKAVEERNNIVRDLLERSQLQESEKERISTTLKEKEDELEKARKEVDKLSRKVLFTKLAARDKSQVPEDEAMNEFTAKFVIPSIFDQLTPPNFDATADKFELLKPHLPKRYMRDFAERGYYSSRLTLKGYQYLKRIKLDIKN